MAFKLFKTGPSRVEGVKTGTSGFNAESIFGRPNALETSLIATGEPDLDADHASCCCNNCGIPIGNDREGVDGSKTGVVPLAADGGGVGGDNDGGISVGDM